MFSHHARWYLSTTWIAVALLGFIASGVSSVQAIVFLAVLAFVPPVVMMMLSKAPPLTIAEVLHATKERR